MQHTSTTAVLSKEDSDHARSLTPDLEDGAKVEPVISHTGTLGGEVGTVKAISFDGHVFLIPTPSDDPNDPLNWSRPYKWFVTIVSCLLVFIGTMMAGGPAAALLDMAMTYRTDIQTTSYLITIYGLLMGFGLLFWAPLIAKFGPRLSYVTSSILVFVFTIWLALAQSYESAMAARVLSAISVAASEGLAPVTISDIWFLHERGLPLGVFSGALMIGPSIGSVLVGSLDYRTHSFRNAYWLFAGMAGLVCVLVILFFPDTSYKRDAMQMKHAHTQRHIDYSQKRTLFSKENLAIWKGSQTQESFFRLMVRPIGTWLLPSVVWAALVYAGTVGFVIALSTNVAAAFMPPPFLFNVEQVGFVGFSGVVGAVLATSSGGRLTDFIANRLVRRNGGMREPEMRIPGIVVPLCIAPLGLALYGAGTSQGWHWIVPVIGYGLVAFAAVWATGIAFAYVVDCYKPIAAEAVSGMMALKSVFGFIISFYTNTWVANQGGLHAFGEMAGVSAFCLGLGLFFFLFGKTLRQRANKSRALSFLRWNDDRDDLVVFSAH